MAQNNKHLRVYPTSCTSAFCGRLDCTGCKHLPALEEFKVWRERAKAVQEDPVWCPTVWAATAE